MARAACRKAAFSTAAGAAELLDVFFLQPLAVESRGVQLECSIASEGRFDVRSGASTPAEASLTGTTAHCTGSASAGLKAEANAAVHASVRAQRVIAADVREVYEGYNGVGLHYGPAFRSLAQSWADKSLQGALAQLRYRAAGWATPQIHPADLDGALQLSAAGA